MMFIRRVIWIVLAALWVRTAAAQSECWPGRTWDFWHGCLGDVTADGPVNQADIDLVASELGRFSWVSDIDGDGIVADADLDLVLADAGSNCAWPPDRHAVLRLVRDSSGADIWLDLPADVPGGTYGVAGIQAWLVTEPGLSGSIEADPQAVWVDLCGNLGAGLFENGRIGFAWGAAPGAAWAGTVHLGRINGRLGRYVVLYRSAGPPARCAEVTPSGVRPLRFLVEVVDRDPQPPTGARHGKMVVLPR